jgi:hypothetical protein
MDQWRCLISERYETAKAFTTDDSVMIEEAHFARQIKEILDLQPYLPLLKEIENVSLKKVLNSRCPVHV